MSFSSQLIFTFFTFYGTTQYYWPSGLHWSNQANCNWTSSANHKKSRKAENFLFFFQKYFTLKKSGSWSLFFQVNIMERMVELGCDPLAANRWRFTGSGSEHYSITRLFNTLSLKLFNTLKVKEYWIQVDYEYKKSLQNILYLLFEYIHHS